MPKLLQIQVRMNGFMLVSILSFFFLPTVETADYVILRSTSLLCVVFFFFFFAACIFACCCAAASP